MDNSVVISGGRTIRGLNGNEKNRVKMKSKIKIKKKLISLCTGTASFSQAKVTDKDTSGSRKGKLLRLCLLNHILQFGNKASYF